MVMGAKGNILTLHLFWPQSMHSKKSSFKALMFLTSHNLKGITIPLPHYQHVFKNKHAYKMKTCFIKYTSIKHILSLNYVEKQSQNSCEQNSPR
jgi:hypothetical protein